MNIVLRAQINSMSSKLPVRFIAAELCTLLGLALSISIFLIFFPIKFSCGSYFVPAVAFAGTASVPCTEPGCSEKAYYVDGSSLNKAATCTTDGQLCFQHSSPAAAGGFHTTLVSVPATGHAWQETQRIEATCTTDGYVTYACSNSGCGETKTDTIAALGHDYPDTWTVQRQATEQSEGLKYRICTRCGNRSEKAIPKLGTNQADGQDEGDEETDGASSAIAQNSSKTATSEQDFPVGAAAAAGIAGVAAVVGLGYGLIVRPRKLAAVAGTSAMGAVSAMAAGVSSSVSAAEAAELAFSPNRNPKTILLCLDENTASGSLVQLMRNRHFLKVCAVSPAEIATLPEIASDMAPELIVLHLDSPDDLDRMLLAMNEIRATYKDALFAFVADDMVDGIRDDALAADITARLDALVSDKTIMAYVFDSANDKNELVKLVLPLYKSSIVGDNALQTVGIVAEAMGIPGVSTAVDLFSNSREIKETLMAGDMSVGDKAVVISDIASILGFDEISNVAEFIDNANTAKEALQSDEKNAAERADAVEAGVNMIGTILG